MRRLGLLMILLSGQTTAQQTSLQTVQRIDNVQTQLVHGKLEGQQAGGVNWFLGVPFAQPPLGQQRWRPPLPVKPWKGVRQAKAFRADCIQGKLGREDCLYLNIYQPEHARNAPMMVWIHGGFFTGGSANIFDGSRLAHDYGVVVVSVSYRVGLLGFLAAPGLGEGNYGLYDILESLRWLRQNAPAFGGNASNVTLFGNSAGSAAICHLMTSPLATGLFHKAILQSGSCTSPIFTTTRAAALKNGQTYLNHFDCRNKPVGECLRAKTVKELTRYPLPSQQPFNPVPLPPVSDTSLLPLTPSDAFRSGRFNKLPVLLGSNREEIRVFEPFIPPLLRKSHLTYWAGINLLDRKNAGQIMNRYPANAREPAVETLLRSLTDRYFACPTARLSRQLSFWSPTYAYEFSDANALLEVNDQDVPVGAVHGSEIPYVFSTAVAGVSNPVGFNFPQQQLSKQIGSYWTTFAKSGRPLALGLTNWPPVTPLHTNVLTLDSGHSGVTEHFPAVHQCDFWNGLDP